ncbi:type II methionyl aminopeptidase [Patescibacteria group bacterium]|nr:type II methionyl aminopeptidase [Patescibacteria group bacterium]
MESSKKEKIIKAGKIASEVRDYARGIIKKDTPLIEIVEKIESKIFELGGKPAFPTTLSIDNVAAHYTPSYDDKTLSKGLLKIDFGVHIDGWTADNAFSVDLENNEENKRLIKASQDALENSIKLIKEKLENNLSVNLTEIGTEISKTIESNNFFPVINLTGHSMEQYNLHSGISIPNIETSIDLELEPGLYAIEPFATNGSGKVHDGKPSGIYELKSEKNVRSPIAREVLSLIINEYNTLPFCSRWIVKKIGSKAIFGLKQLEENGNLYQFPELIEISDSRVSQTEHTILIDKNGKVIITTE